MIFFSNDIKAVASHFVMGWLVQIILAVLVTNIIVFRVTRVVAMLVDILITMRFYQ